MPTGVSDGTIKIKAKERINRKLPNVSLAMILISLSFLALAMKSIWRETETKISPTRVAAAEPVSM